MTSWSSQAAYASGWGTSVPFNASRTRYSRSMVSLRPLGTDRGGRRRTARKSPRLMAKISFEAPPLMKRDVTGSPRPGKSCLSIHWPSRSSSTKPAVRAIVACSSSLDVVLATVSDSFVGWCRLVAQLAGTGTYVRR